MSSEGSQFNLQLGAVQHSPVVVTSGPLNECFQVSLNASLKHGTAVRNNLHWTAEVEYVWRQQECERLYAIRGCLDGVAVAHKVYTSRTFRPAEEWNCGCPS
jgi:hypothetical protein